MKKVLLILLLGAIVCNGQPVDYCNFMKLTLNNVEFVKLFRVDTAYNHTIYIIDDSYKLGDCKHSKIIGHHNVYEIIDTIPFKSLINSKERFYKCDYLDIDNDDHSQYVLDMIDYRGHFISVFFRKKNGNWKLHHFIYAPSNFLSNPSKEDVEATNKANIELKRQWGT